MNKTLEITIENLEHTTLRVDAFLSLYTGESRSIIKENESTIQVNHVHVKPGTKLKLNDVVSFSYSEKTNKETLHLLKPENIALDIIYEDDSLLVVNKPYGMVVHPAKGNWDGTLANALAYHLNIANKEDLRPGIVHRLDKNTSGLMVVAKDSKTQKGLMNLFKNRKVLKIYTALVSGHLSHSYGKIEESIARHPKDRLLFEVNPTKGKKALTEYQVVKEFTKASLLSLRIHTGRTHQIRVHLSFKKNPIIGDTTYGSTYTQFPLCLISQKLAFIHPVTQKELSFKIPIPSYMQDVIEFFEKK